MKIKILLFLFVFAICLQISLNAQWSSSGNNIIPSNHRVWSIKIAPDESIWAISTFDNFPPINNFPKVHRSTDRGNSWTRFEIPNAINDYGWDISPVDSMNAFIGLHDAGVFKTADGGMSWDKIESYPYRAYHVHFFNSNDGWILGNEKTPERRLVMSLTSDGGQTWTHTGHGVGQPEGTSIPVNPYELLAFGYSVNSSYDVYGNTIILGRILGNYWRSDDMGYNWTNHSTPLISQGIIASNIAMKDENTFMVAGDRLSSNGDLVPTRNYTTKDGGLTWEIAGMSGMTAAATHYIPNSDSVFVMVGHNNFGSGLEGTAISYNYGETWDRIDNTSLIAIDFIDENTGVGSCCNNGWSTANGQIHLWDFDLSTSTIDIVESSLIKLVPNPVSFDLTINTGGEFQATTLLIEVISTNGQSVMREEYPNAREINIPTGHLPKGFYTLRVTGNQKSVLKKFIKQ